MVKSYEILMKLKCVLVDDEPLALRILQDYIKQVDFLDFQAEFDDPVEALNYLKNHQVDVLFLDIRMNKLTGIQLLHVLKNKPFVILTTAYEEYALKGYELDVADYLLKPISFERFILAVDKVYEKAKLHTANEPIEPMFIANPKENFLFVKTGSQLRKINFDDILYIEGMSEYLNIVTVSESIMTLQNFARMSAVLPDENFIRVHKSYMVAINKIQRIERNRIYILKKVIPVSDTYKDDFYNRIDKNSL